jgi:mgtE-like transporter
MARPNAADLVPRRAKHVYRSLRSERRTLRQGLAALLLSTAAAFVAGLTLSHITGTLDRVPGLLALIPASVGMRGTVFGSIGARLGTSIHAGLFEVTLAKGSVLRHNVEVGLISTFTSSLLVAVLARLFSAAFGTEAVSLSHLVSISVIGGALGSAVILVVTIALSVLSFRRGYDLDAVATPMITAIGDMVALPAIFVVAIATEPDVINAVAATVSVIAVVAATWFAVRRADRTVRRTLLEMLPVMVIVPVLDILAGSLLESQRATIAPVVLILIPPFISQAGALGGILSSRLSSKLQLGVIGARAVPEPPARVDGGIVTVFAAVVFTVIGVVAFLLAAVTGLHPPPFTQVLGGTLLAGLLALPILIGTGYYVAVGTTESGLDPDNYGVPFITGLMDLTGIICILFAMSLWG